MYFTLCFNKLGYVLIPTLQVKTAMQLAHYRNEPLEYSHFERVIDVANEFEEYLVNTHGHTDDEWARAQKTRF